VRAWHAQLVVQRLTPDFLDDDEAHRKSKDMVLTVSSSSIEWYMAHMCGTSSAGAVVENVPGLG
jgi:hypothetical protein